MQMLKDILLNLVKTRVNYMKFVFFLNICVKTHKTLLNFHGFLNNLLKV